MHSLTRRHLIGGAAVAVLPAVAGVPAASAALPKPAPVGDDAGFLSFLAASAKVQRDLYVRTGRIAGFGATETKLLARLVAVKRTTIVKVTGPLGADAPQAGDFDSTFADADLSDRASALALAEKLERLVCGVEVYGVAFAADPATRLLLGRLLATDAQALCVVRSLAAKGATVAPTGLIDPIDLDTAGAALDTYLTSPTAPQES